MFSFSSKKKKPHSGKKEKKEKGSDEMGSPHHHHSRRPRPRLDRRNASKNIDYDAITDSSSSSSLPHPASPSSPELLRATRSLDLSPSYSNQTSFRIGGSIEGEVDMICRSLGLSGPEDFAIPAAAWEASRAHRSSSDLLPRSRLSPKPAVEAEGGAGGGVDGDVRAGFEFQDLGESSVEIREFRADGGGGIKGVRPPTLTTPEAMKIETRSAPPTVSGPVPSMKLNPSPSSVLNPPPSMTLPEIEKVGSSWDLVMAFAPEEKAEEEAARRFSDSDEEAKEEREVKKEEEEEEVRERLGGETSEDITSTSNYNDNDDDSSSTTTEPMFVISPNGKFKKKIKSWMKGQLLGSGSFGTVYEGISE